MMRKVTPFVVLVGFLIACAGPPPTSIPETTWTPTITPTWALKATPTAAPTWTPAAEPAATPASTRSSAPSSTCDPTKTKVFVDEHSVLMDEWFATVGRISEQKHIIETQPIIEDLQDIMRKVSDLDAPCQEAEDVIAATRSFMEKEIRATVATIREDPDAKDLVEEATEALREMWEHYTELRVYLPGAAQ
jgi:hypothetical protein